ncbi:MAG: triple tyrosine motif-containing protein [Bacteroidales bacterium]
MSGSGKTYLLLFLLQLLSLSGIAQIKGIGLPFIVNHPRDIYNAGTQNWSATQGSNGFMYFGNNDGVLEYNGNEWNLYPMPNNSVVREVMASGDSIFAGAFEEIGYLAPGEDGHLSWNSLTHLIPTQYRNFDEVWNIYKDGDRIIFQSFEYIFIIEGTGVEIIEPEKSFGFMHQTDEAFYVTEEEQGLLRLEDNTLIPVSDHPVFFRNEISCIVSHDYDRMLIGTSNEGIFIMDGKDMTPWQGEINAFLLADNLYSGIRLSDGNLAFGSVSEGVFITDRDGNILQHLNRTKGLQNNTILDMFQDRHNNLWMGLDNGIDYVEISSPITMFDHNYNIESVYATLVHNNILYVGTNQGLFAARMEYMGNWANDRTGFRLVEGTRGQVWSLEVIDNTLLCGHNYGAFQVEGFSARQISDIRGFWSFLKPETTGDMIIAGTYNGLVRLRNQDGNWQMADEVSGFRESSRNIFLDDNNVMWIAHGYRGLFKLELNSDLSQVQNVYLYHNEANLPVDLPYNIQEIQGEMRVTTRDGIYYYDHNLKTFVPDNNLNDLFRNKGFIDKIHQDENGSLWYYTDDYLGVMRMLEDGTYRNITSPFTRINPFLLPAFQNLFRLDQNHVFIGSQNGLIHYDPGIINEYQQTEKIFFTEILFYGRQKWDSLLTYSDEIQENRTNVPVKPHAMNSVRFRFTTPIYENPDEVRFSFRLLGFETEWSDWTVNNFKEYTNLREGDYVFEIKAQNAFGVESAPKRFDFTIEPPLHRSTIAYVVYGLLLAIIIGANAYYLRKRILRIRQREKVRHEKRLARKEEIFKAQTALSEKEIIELRNEGLKNEMQHKNKELANATMHLIQKNKTLTELKNDLAGLLKNMPVDHPDRQHVNNLLKKVNRDLRNEKHWELFNSYFDEVHQDFLNRLKEKHSDLMPKELRLCAYLRMNLSTKEIAPLMNISVRGVEISRYRLRKKLKLNKHINLTDYMMSQ